MKIQKHPYTLVFKGSLKKREGALLQVEYPDGRIGFADCHPWEELGDLPLSKQLELLALGKTTPLTERSLYFAKIDAEARSENRSLFDNVAIPQSYSLLMGMEEFRGESVIKIKVKKEDKDKLKAFLDFPVRVRLDFNGKLSKREFLFFLEGLPLDRIDYIEDPFAYDEKEWKAIQNNYPVALACDAGSEGAIHHEESAPFLIVKPAKQSELSFASSKQKIVVTSYLDHPLGQLCAAYSAAKLNQTISGLLSHLVYHNNPFSQRLEVRKNVLIPPKGTGFGFDDLLKECIWYAL